MRQWFAHPHVGPALRQALTAGVSKERLAAADETAHLIAIGKEQS